jgi:hypothetical protein
MLTFFRLSGVLLESRIYEAKRKAAMVLSGLPIRHQPRAMEAFMRAHHVIAVLIIGLGAKQFVFPPKQADANIIAVPSASVNVLQMHSGIDMRTLPLQKINDKSFIFTDEN